MYDYDDYDIDDLWDAIEDCISDIRQANLARDKSRAENCAERLQEIEYVLYRKLESRRNDNDV